MSDISQDIPEVISSADTHGEDMRSLINTMSNMIQANTSMLTGVSIHNERARRNNEPLIEGDVVSNMAKATQEARLKLDIVRERYLASESTNNAEG